MWAWGGYTGAFQCLSGGASKHCWWLESIVERGDLKQKSKNFAVLLSALFLFSIYTLKIIFLKAVLF